LPVLKASLLVGPWGWQCLSTGGFPNQERGELGEQCCHPALWCCHPALPGLRLCGGVSPSPPGQKWLLCGFRVWGLMCTIRKGLSFLVELDPPSRGTLHTGPTQAGKSCRSPGDAWFRISVPVSAFLRRIMKTNDSDGKALCAETGERSINKVVRSLLYISARTGRSSTLS
jgi:hypothetical protein